MSDCHHYHYPVNHDRCAPECDDQLPLISRVGRGIKGDSYRVQIQSDSNCETILEGLSYDEATKTWSTEWESENINGGCLSYQYRLRPYTVPQTFTITFVYRRPGRPEWSWTTPAIPYIWDADDDGKADVDGIVGSGVATIFIRAGKDKPWKEYLEYPEGYTRDDFNAPDQGEAWTSNITFGVGGDIELPNLDDLAKVIGVSTEIIRNIINGVPGAMDGSDNVKDYVDDRLQDAKDYADGKVSDLNEHFHTDLGFNEPGHSGTGAFGGEDNVKEYIDKKVSDLEDSLSGDIDDLRTYVKNALGDILNKVFGGGQLGEDGHITWPNTNKIPVADLNVFANSTPTDATYTDAIRSRALSDDDVRVI